MLKHQKTSHPFIKTPDGIYNPINDSNLPFTHKNGRLFGLAKNWDGKGATESLKS